MQQHTVLQVWITICNGNRWHFQYHDVFISTIAYFGQGNKGIAFRNYSKSILSSDSTCHIAIHLSNNLSIDVLTSWHSWKLSHYKLPSMCFACYKLHPFCSQWCVYSEWNAVLRCAMHGQIYLVISTFHNHRNL